MLVHKKVLRAKMRALAVATVVIGTVFMSVFGFVTLKWVYAYGPEHAKMFSTMAMYSQKIDEKTVVVVPEKFELEEKKVDPRKTDLFQRKVASVRKFLRKYNAPLANNAEDFVRASTLYGIDYRLLPAISIIESGGGKKLFRKNNPFGWGKSGYPTCAAAMNDVARGLSRYYADGLRKPEQIAYRYNPVTPESWGRKARSLMNSMPAL